MYSCNGDYDFTKPIDGAASFLSGTLVLPIGETEVLISDIIDSLQVSNLNQDNNSVYYIRFDSTTTSEIEIPQMKLYPVDNKVEIDKFLSALISNAGGDPNNPAASLHQPLYVPEPAVIYEQSQTLLYEIDSRIEELDELLFADNTIMEVSCQTVGLYGGKSTGAMELTLDFSDTRIAFSDGSAHLTYDIVLNSTPSQVRSKSLKKSLLSLTNSNPQMMGKLMFRATLKTKASTPGVDPSFNVTELNPKIILDIAISSNNQKETLNAKRVSGRFDIKIDSSIGVMDVQNIFESYPEGNLLMKGAKLDITVDSPVNIPLKVDIDISSLDYNDNPIQSYAQIRDRALAARYMAATPEIIHYGEDIVNQMVADRSQMSRLVYTVQGVTDKEPTYLHHIDPNTSTFLLGLSYSFYVPLVFKQGGYLLIDKGMENVISDQVKDIIKGVESAYIYVDYRNWLPLDLDLTLIALDAQGKQIGVLGSELVVKAGIPNGLGIIDPTVLDPVLGGPATVGQLEIALNNDKMKLLQQSVGIGYKLTLRPNSEVDFAAISSKAKLDIKLSLKKGRGGFNIDLFGGQP